MVLVKKGVIDCENDTQCADDRACVDSLEQPGRMMCEKPCHPYRTRCDVPYSECVAEDHVARCECKEEFHGNGSVACIPNGFEEKNNSCVPAYRALKYTKLQLFASSPKLPHVRRQIRGLRQRHGPVREPWSQVSGQNTKQ